VVGKPQSTVVSSSYRRPSCGGQPGVKSAVFGLPPTDEAWGNFPIRPGMALVTGTARAVTMDGFTPAGCASSFVACPRHLNASVLLSLTSRPWCSLTHIIGSIGIQPLRHSTGQWESIGPPRKIIISVTRSGIAVPCLMCQCQGRHHSACPDIHTACRPFLL